MADKTDKHLPGAMTLDEIVGGVRDFAVNSGLCDVRQAEEGDEDVCPKTADGKHFPVAHTLAAAEGYDTAAEGGVVFDITCKHCGRSGSGRINLDDIMW